MGTVYLANERELDRLVAIKVLNPDLAASPERRQRFRREARIAAHLRHPHIVPLHTFGEAAGVWYFVMEYVRGETLDNRLRLEGKLTVDETRRILIALADALECAHRHGVVHRDIKPANILLDSESGQPILADFGISKSRDAGDSVTATGEICGTPLYMAPEQWLPSSIAEDRSDIYSLGVVGYRMLAGHEPSADASHANDAAAQRRRLEDAPPLQLVAPAVPPDLAAVIMRCLAREPSLRWPNARSLRNALERTGAEAAPVLPDELRHLPGFGLFTLAWVCIWAGVAFLGAQSRHERVLLLLIAFLIPVGTTLHVWNMGVQGASARQLLRITCWPPTWWGMWWPRGLRRPTDLWPRLPWPARAVRGVLSAFIIALPLILLAEHQLLDANALSPPERAGRWFVFAELALVLITGVIAGLGAYWAYRRDLSVVEAVHVLFGATTSSHAWRRPRIAQLLTSATRGVRQPDRDTPADYPRAIDDFLSFLPPETAALGTDVLRVARRLLAAITSADAHITSLAQETSGEEFDRLRSKLAALEQAAREGSDDQELRGLVERKLDVARGMRARHDLALQHRARLLDLMRDLWAHLCVLTDPTATVAETSARADRLRRLCDAVVAEIRASRSP